MLVHLRRSRACCTQETNIYSSRKRHPKRHPKVETCRNPQIIQHPKINISYNMSYNILIYHAILILYIYIYIICNWQPKWSFADTESPTWRSPSHYQSGPGCDLRSLAKRSKFYAIALPLLNSICIYIYIYYIYIYLRIYLLLYIIILYILNYIKLCERRRKPGSDLVLILISFRDGFRGSFARTVLAFAATCIS